MHTELCRLLVRTFPREFCRKSRTFWVLHLNPSNITLHHLSASMPPPSSSKLKMAARSTMSVKGRNVLKWSLDLSSRLKYPLEKHSNQSSELVAPVGYTDKQLPNTDAHEIDDNLVTKKSWDIAIGPIKQIPMTLFIMYMAGNTISLFPIMMVGMMFLKPIKALFSIQTAFATLEGEQSFLMKVVYLFGNVVLLLMALYKCHYMGLLPLSPSDWIEFAENKERLEFSGGGLSLQSL